MSCARLLLVAVALAGCEDYHECAPPSSADLSALPLRLSETGLFADIASETLGDGVRPYAPQFELWADGADKRRWIRLPPGAVIDTSDMDFWELPEGTRIWKEFTRDGIRVETRLMQRVADDWIFAAYVWEADGSDAALRPFGVENALGTRHDVPAATECIGCHGGIAGRALGVSAVQLSWDAPAGQLDLADLIAGGMLSDPPAGSFDVPGDETERAALGYLHANCGHCHNQERPPTTGPRCFDPESRLDFWLRVDALAPSDTPAYRTAIGDFVVRGDPDDSDLIERIESRAFFGAMPPLGTDEVDREGADLLRRWVRSL